MSRVWGGTAFAKRSVAMKAPVGLLSGRAVLRSKMEGHCPDKLGGICDKGYHGLRRASRWFCKIYGNKVEGTELFCDCDSFEPFDTGGFYVIMDITELTYKCHLRTQNDKQDDPI